MKIKKIFESPFIGTSIQDGITLLYSATGNYSSVLQIENLAEQYCADSKLYELYQQSLGQIVKILGAGYIIQKTDIISKQTYRSTSSHREWLDDKFFKHFNGRVFTCITTYLTITKENNKSRLFTFKEDEVKDFANKIAKVSDALQITRMPVSILNEPEIKLFLNRFISFNFSNESFQINNFSADEQGIYFGNKELRIISLIDIDELNIPNTIASNSIKADLGKDYPIDNFGFLLSVPEAETILYNQCIFVPDQLKLKRDLELKKKRHSSMPDPANNVAVEDIDDMFLDIAKQNELLVYSHFSILVQADPAKINKAINYIDTQLFAMGIIAGKNSYNQIELFRAAIPGNAGELQIYDKFLTSRPAAICFFFKERLPISEQSDYLLYFTDRQGIPIGIDTSELPMNTNRISNRNKFILGPSGSGKSFFTNRYVKQCRTLGADIVLVDTGHSYLGLCNYFKGKYITYREDKPITMNPFKITREENNEEKRQIIKSLLGLIWKGADGTLTQVEDSILGTVINEYFYGYFGESKKISELKFDSFYEFAIGAIQKIIETEDLKFDLKEFRFILKKFYKGGEYDKLLNDDFESTLFEEPFIVFEIDSIKEHKLLFPITTLIIMDVFLQKMRFKKNKKILIIEEAWKAIASPMMAGYILYLYKTVRKFNGEAIVVTQELSDIIGNAIVKDSILANSDTICLLDQTKFKDRYDDIAQLLSLNEIEKNKIFTINQLENKENRSRFKEVYIKRGSVGEVYGVEVPLEEYLTYTTELSEKTMIAIYMNQYGDYQGSIDKIITDLKTSGLKLPQFVTLVNKQNAVFNSITSKIISRE
jgi:conjugation system TraG family ATPase